MKVIILDTSSIIFGLSNRIDTFQRLKESFPTYRITIPYGVVRELKRIANGKKKEKLQARIGLGLIKEHAISVVSGREYVDTWIIKHSGSSDTIICTNDVELKQKLKGMGSKTISISRSGMLR